VLELALVAALLGGLDVFGRGVTLLRRLGLAGEEDEAGVVGLQALDVGGEGLLGEVLSAGVDCDTDGCSKLARNLGGLSTISTYTGGLTFCYSYLELGQAESSSSADFAVVLEAGATDDGPQFVDGARSNARSLLLTGIAARLLLAGLEIFEPMSESDVHDRRRRLYPHLASEVGITWSKCTRTRRCQSLRKSVECQYAAYNDGD